MPFIKIGALQKAFLNKEKEKSYIIRDFSLSVDRGEFITFFGPNGCGKTTLLNILAGLIDFDSGSVEIDGRPVKEAHIGYVFQQSQNYLLPWRTNADNMMLALEFKGVPKKERSENLENLLQKLDVSMPLERYPYQLSGGQQKLVSIIQAILGKPDILLMDEPFVGLDFLSRVNMQEKLLDIWQKTKLTVLLVSHDIDEAVFLANRVVLLSNRPASVVSIEQVPLGYPRDIKALGTPIFAEIRHSILTKIGDVMAQ